MAKETEKMSDDLKKVLDAVNKETEVRNSINYIDLDTLNFEKSDVVKQQEALTTIFSAKPAFQIVCAQSGYMAKIAPLLYKDIIAILNSSLSTYESKKEIYKIVYSKITEFSTPNWKPTFEEWLNLTSLGDLETLYYGLYCATFQEKSTVSFDCPYCEETIETKLENSQLVRVENREEMLELTTNIAKNADTLEKIKEFSSVVDSKKNNVSIMLPESKIVFVLRIPSLQKTLDMLKLYNDAEIQSKTNDELNIMLTTCKIAIPDKDNKYSYIENRKDIDYLIGVLGINDISIVRKAVNKLLDDKKISYYAENQKCTYCGEVIPRVAIDMEQLLFFQIGEKQLI